MIATIGCEFAELGIEWEHSYLFRHDETIDVYECIESHWKKLDYRDEHLEVIHSSAEPKIANIETTVIVITLCKYLDL